MKSETVVNTPNGEVCVHTFASPEEIRSLDFDRQFAKHTHYRSLYTRKESLITRTFQEDANVVLALTEHRKIIGFGVLVYPDPDERWAHLEPRVMMEVKAVEVSRGWRAGGIGNAIVEGMLAHPELEEKILYLVGYSWTWDLEGSQLAASKYRDMMIRLFKPYGFKEYATNEPNICLSPDNLFMARIGKLVSEKIREDFKWLCFGIY